MFIRVSTQEISRSVDTLTITLTIRDRNSYNEVVGDYEFIFEFEIISYGKLLRIDSFGFITVFLKRFNDSQIGSRKRFIASYCGFIWRNNWQHNSFIIAAFRKEKISGKLFKQNIRDLSYLVVLRFIVGELIFTYGLVKTSAIKAIFFTKIEPFFVLILAWFVLKEKIRTRHLLLLAIHLFGAILLSTGGFLSIPRLGDLLVIFAMFCFAATYIAGKQIAHNIGSTLGNAIPMGIASLLLFPFAIFSSSAQLFSYSLKGWESLFIYVILFNVIALTLWYFSLKAVKGWIVSALRYVGPILGAPIAYFLFGQTLSVNQIFGAGVIIVTSLLIAGEHFNERKKTN